MAFDFIEEFKRKIDERNINWEVSALAARDGRLFSLGSDSKLIGRIFELISYNILQEIADENNYILQPSNRQTVYPDFTMMKSERDEDKIAIDIKTTYRTFRKNGKPCNYEFTLGSYKTNNITYLIKGEGPFSALGLSMFEKYWKGYPKYREEPKNYTSLEEYFEWCEKNGQNAEDLRRVYTHWKETHQNN